MISFPTAAHIFIGQKFGNVAESYTGMGYRGHMGVDLLTPVSTPVYACDDGQVIEAVEKTGGYGRHIFIQHSGYVSVYGHLKNLIARTGDKVISGQRIGGSGGSPDDPYSGASSGPHLHFEIRPEGEPKANGYGGAVDPLTWLIEHFLPPALYRISVTIDRGVSIRTMPVMDFNPTYGRCGVLAKNEVADGMELDSSGKFVRLRSIRPEWLPVQFVSLTKVPVTVTSPITATEKSVEDRLTVLEKILQDHGWMSNVS